MQIRGIIPPVATPMQANEDLDLPRLKWFLDHLIKSGVHGVFVLGTNSEFYALDEREKQEVIATTVAHVNRRVAVFAGTGAETTREAVRLTKMAERERADGVSVITPYFVSPSQQEIFDHYRRIAESTSLPVILYNNPSTCGGVRIDVDTVARLAELPNILGMKDSSGDLQNTNECVRVAPERFSVMQGRDTEFDLRRSRSRAGDGQHRPSPVRGNLRSIPTGRSGGGQSGPAPAKSNPAQSHTGYGPGRRESCIGAVGDGDGVVPVSRGPAVAGEAAEDAGGPAPGRITIGQDSNPDLNRWSGSES